MLCSELTDLCPTFEPWRVGSPHVMEWMLALVAGIMVALTFIELLPSTLEIVAPRSMACSCSFGMLFMFCSKEVSRMILEAVYAK